MVHQLTEKDFTDFISQREFAVVHFDSEWDVGCRPPMQWVMSKASEEFPDVNFGEMDPDQNIELAKSIGVNNIPTVAYYRRGHVVAALPGATQNVPERLRRIMRGGSIGKNDDTGVAPSIRAADSPFRWRY